MEILILLILMAMHLTISISQYSRINDLERAVERLKSPYSWCRYCGDETTEGESECENCKELLNL